MNPSDPSPTLPSALYTESDLPPTLPGLLDAESGLSGSWRTPLDQLDLLERERPAQATPWLYRQAILLAGLWAVLLTTLALALATGQPWLGLRLAAQDGQVQVVDVVPGSPAAVAGVHVGAQLQALATADGTQAMTLQLDDLRANPDELASYADWGRFYERQDRLARLLGDASLRLTMVAHGAQEEALLLRPAPTRPPGSLPPLFWTLMVLQAAIMLMAGWVITVYPPQPAAPRSAVGAMAISLVLAGVAVFGTRELALPSTLFHALVVLQHAGSLVAALAVASILSHYPSRLPEMGGWRVWVVAGLFLLWALADAGWWLPSPNWASRAMLLAAVVVVTVQAVRQWQLHSGGDSVARDEARTQALIWIPAAFCLFGLREGALLLGWAPPLSQAWLYGLVVVAVAGRAVTHREVRVFELDDWTRQVLLTWGAGVTILLCYRLLQASRWLSDELAMLVSVLGLGLIYVLLTRRIWGRGILRRSQTQRELTSAILALGLTAPEDRGPLWMALLENTFEARVSLADGAQPYRVTTVLDGGRTLWVPPVAGLPGVLLGQRDRGRPLFARSDRRMAARLSALAAQIIHARDAYVRGASEERLRIADDLHDDLGAKLLSLAHAGEQGEAGADVARLAREALEEMRLSVRHLKAQPMPAADVLADWRAETVARLSAAGVQVDWDAQLSGRVAPLPMRTVAHLTRVLREAVSNIIHHSGASYCRVLLQLSPTALHLDVEDNGQGMGLPGARGGAGGLSSIERRVRRLGGTHRFGSGALGGTLLMVRVPLESPHS